MDSNTRSSPKHPLVQLSSRFNWSAYALLCRTFHNI